MDAPWKFEILPCNCCTPRAYVLTAEQDDGDPMQMIDMTKEDLERLHAVVRVALSKIGEEDT